MNVNVVMISASEGCVVLHWQPAHQECVYDQLFIITAEMHLPGEVYFLLLTDWLNMQCLKKLE